MPHTSVVLLFHQPWLSRLTNGMAPLAVYSHDQHLLQFGHESLRKGFDVYIEPAREAGAPASALRVKQFFPVLETEAVSASSRAAPDFVVAVYPQSLNLRKLYPAAKIVGILPAVNLFEHPEKPTPGWVLGFFMAARSQIDFYLTQNERMADIARCLFRSIAQVDLRDRILVCPLGIVEGQHPNNPPHAITRAEMGLEPDDVAFINAGGPWSWTDYNTFLRAFCNVTCGTPNLKFYLMGFKQPENPDHAAYIAETKAIIAAHADLIGRNLIVCEDWHEASAKVSRFTYAADIGVNVNKNTAENWQSYRLRFLEYMKAGIPVINTVGDYLSDTVAADAVYPVRAGDVESCETAIRLAAADSTLRQHKTAAMKRCAGEFDSRNTYGRTIDRLLVLPRRNFDNPKEVFEPSLLTLPAPETTAWTSAAVDTPAEEACGNQVWRAPADWRDGDGPVVYTLPPLSVADKAMSLGFLIELREAVNAGWVAVLQVGAQPDKARLTICLGYAGQNAYRLVFRLFDRHGKALQLVTPDIPVGQSIRCSLSIVPAAGQVQIRIDGRMLDSGPLSPWEWIATDRIWLGSQRLCATLREVWLAPSAGPGIKK